MLYYDKHSSWLDPCVKDDDARLFLSAHDLRILATYRNIPREKIAERLLCLQYFYNSILNRGIDDPKQEIFLGVLEKRITYFKNLQFLYEKEIIYPDNNPNIYDTTKVEKYFFGEKGIASEQNEAYTKRYLNNTPMYDERSNSYWGELWLELIDPAHRQLDFYKEEWLKRKDKDSFFIFLEKYPVSSREPMFVSY